MNRYKVNLESAFTLVETIVVLTLASLILVAVLSVYGRMRANAVTLMGHLEKNQLQTEILQKIAEDIDRLAAPGFDAVINFNNRISGGYHSAELILTSSYYGNEDKKETYEQVEWRTSYDAGYDTLKLYRMHGGLNVEDKVLGIDPEQPPYIPVAEGLTHFEVKAQQGETVLGNWASETLPKAVRIGISFALPEELEDGSIGIPEEAITFRTVAIDRTRLIPYEFVKKKFELPDEDPNDLMTDDDPNSFTEDMDSDTLLNKLTEDETELDTDE